jgi:hypothetical protein
VRKQDLAVVRQQLRNYQRLRELIDRWITLGMELSRLRLQPSSERSRGVSPKRLKAETVAKLGARVPLLGQGEAAATGHGGGGSNHWGRATPPAGFQQVTPPPWRCAPHPLSRGGEFSCNPPVSRQKLA